MPAPPDPAPESESPSTTDASSEAPSSTLCPSPSRTSTDNRESDAHTPSAPLTVKFAPLPSVPPTRRRSGRPMGVAGRSLHMRRRRANIDRQYTASDDGDGGDVDDDDKQGLEDLEDAQRGKKKIWAKGRQAPKAEHGSSTIPCDEGDAREHYKHRCRRPCAGVDFLGDSFSHLGRLFRSSRAIWRKDPREGPTTTPEALDQKQGLEC